MVVHVALGLSGNGGGLGDWSLYEALIAGSGLAILVRARLLAADRLAWTLIGAGVLMWAAGEVHFQFWVEPAADAPYPSIADALYFAFYGLCFVGVVLLTHAASREVAWLDGALAAVAAGTVWVALVPGAVTDAVGSPTAVATTLAYPFADLVLFTLVINAIAMRGWRIDATWRLLGGGFVLLAVADTVWATETAQDSYVAGAVADWLWPAAGLLIAAAAWRRPTPALDAGPVAGRARVAFVASCLTALTVLVYDHFTRLHVLVIVLAGVTALLAIARALVAVTQADDRLEEIEDRIVLLRVAEQDAHFRSTLLDHMDAAVVATDLQGTITHWSAAAEQLYGYSADEVIGRVAREVMFPPSAEALVERLRFTVSGGASSDSELVVRHKDGSDVVVRGRFAPIMGVAGPVGYVGVSADATEVMEAEQLARRLAAIVESTDDAILSESRDGTIESWNGGAERLYGWSAAEAIGQSIDLIVPPARRKERNRIAATVFAGERIERLETMRRTKDGRILDVSLTLSPLQDADGEVLGVSAIARDITAHRRMQRELRLHAEFDSLTGLFNRRRFEVELKRRVVDGSEGGAVVLLDVDHFKFVNDSLGHAAGDDVLKGVAADLEAEIHGDGVIGRLGGDEFIVLLPGAGETQACEVAAGLLDRVRAHGFRLPVTATAGIAVFGSEDDVPPEGVLVAADVALHEAKEAGRDRVEVYSGARGEGLTWIHRIRQALDRDELVLDAQPIVELASGEVTQEELLVRMRNERGEVIGPAAFLPTAERFGLIREIDRWVIERGIAVAAAGRKVEINLSARSFADAGLPGWIEQQLARAGADPEDVIFEITETALIANMEDARCFAERLCGLGCGFALDDFGTGFGSFTYLKHLPIGHLKIDRDFVRDMASSTSDQRIVRSIVNIAREHGMRTIAEGVEDPAALALLREYGVDFAQGFYLGRPAPLEAAPGAARL
jgi:diguanylate cyclase (GGDEF)-like protein/PAS domain S-box-containing protein